VIANPETFRICQAGLRIQDRHPYRVPLHTRPCGSFRRIHVCRMGYDEHTKGIAMCEESEEGF